MRIRQLNLLSYGRFTNVTVTLPSREQDFHLVFGPNEAGKTTTQAAIEDLLFGVPQTSGYAFVHEYSAMRIGAVIENGDASLELVRRKGKKDTLLEPDGTPFPSGEMQLATLLAGADRDFFERMFSLSQERLRKGGREILEARDEVGQMLFAAGSGIVGLREKLKSLEAEAEGLWTPRRAGHRKFYQLRDRLKDAETEIQQSMVSAKKWKDLKRALDIAQKHYDDLKRQEEETTIELRRLNRIRRVYRNVRRRAELENELIGLDNVAVLPENARAILEEAKRKEAAVDVLLGNLEEQLEKTQEERAALTYDEALLLRHEDIRTIVEKRIKIKSGKEDLPKRRAELAQAESTLQRLAEELEWEADDEKQLPARIPTRAKVNAIRTRLTQRGELLSAVKNGEEAIEAAEEKIGAIEQQLAGKGDSTDISRLAAAVETVKEGADIASRISAVAGEHQDLCAAVSRRRELLRPAVDEEQILLSIPVPSRAEVQAHRDASRDLEKRRQTCIENIRATEQKIDRQQKAHDRKALRENAISPQELSRVRKRRDTGWSLIRRHYVEETTTPENEIADFISEGGGEGSTLVDAYEAAVTAADKTSDRRFDKAEAVAKLAFYDKEITTLKDLLTSLQRERDALDDEQQAMKASWQKKWEEAPFEPLSPDDMLEWMAARNDIIDRIEQRDATERRVAALRGRETGFKSLLLDAFDEMGEDTKTLRDAPLRFVIEKAAALKQRHDKKTENIAQLLDDLERVKREAARKRGGLNRAKEAWSDWETQWKEALRQMNLAPDAAPEVIAAQMDEIDRMREISVRIQELRQERIAKIERDNDLFETNVSKLLKTIAPDLIGIEAEEAVIELEGRLGEAQRTRDLQTQKDKAIVELNIKIEEEKATRQAARGELDHLMTIATVDTVEALENAVADSDNTRKLKEDLAVVSGLLSEEGDGLTIDELENECQDVDIDQVTAREQAMDREIGELRNRLLEAQIALNTEKKACDAVGDKDLTARAAANRQSVLYEMQEVAERYIQVRSSALLLKWAIDRFRVEKQAPMLRRAGRLFATLTDDSFSDLRIEFDDKDNTYLAGVRPDGAIVPTDGMSTGTADQLYLALRIASIEDYLDRAVPLPFIADDLFIHFDDNRAAAGLRVLEELSRKTQVLFFSHHQHLIDVAKRSLNQEPSVVYLDRDTA